MVVIGLTGSIASGKSTVLAWLKELGISVFDSDAAVHELFLHNHDVKDAVRGLWPECVEGQEINRACLRSKVIASKEAIQELEAITHPWVTKKSLEFIRAREQAGDPIVFLDIPLLFEAKQGLPIDQVLVVYCSSENQHKRALSRGTEPSMFDFLISRQLAIDEKLRKSDFQLNTDGTLAETREKLIQLLHDMETKLNVKFI